MGGFFADEYYPSGHFRPVDTAVMVSPRMNTIASRDQFKPIRIGENLVVNYNYLPFSLVASSVIVKRGWVGGGRCLCTTVFLE